MVRTTVQTDRDEGKLSEKALRLLAAHDREVENRQKQDAAPANA
ncbi:hypothetical protein [Roseovarius rhodophyticola]|uniref:Uncharacterized protein n=1 Tax=Roseovarius rhodophyticola TaxID=3080827 RepID=A0ABZ2THX2_9RHOB|nr:hypothetical protein [Roseovarius sp. W115]MDV2929643.1 hypothetical protein [Roseovarius sp. W115]